MTNPFEVGIAFAVGAGLGMLFLASLWHTVRRLPESKHPGLLTSVSMVIRLAAVLLGFYLISGGRWQLLVAALGGFICVRVIILRCVHRQPTPSDQPHGSGRPSS